MFQCGVNYPFKHLYHTSIHGSVVSTNLSPGNKKNKKQKKTTLENVSKPLEHQTDWNWTDLIEQICRQARVHADNIVNNRPPTPIVPRGSTTTTCVKTSMQICRYYWAASARSDAASVFVGVWELLSAHWDSSCTWPPLKWENDPLRIHTVLETLPSVGFFFFLVTYNVCFCASGLQQIYITVEAEQSVQLFNKNVHLFWSDERPQNKFAWPFFSWFIIWNRKSIRNKVAAGSHMKKKCYFCLLFWLLQPCVTQSNVNVQPPALRLSHQRVLPPEQMAVLTPFCSPFMGEYCEMEQRWFPWQRRAQTSKCKARNSRNVADEATQHRVK